MLKKEKNFPEIVIISLLKSYPRKNAYEFIHQLLIDESISIDYNYYWADYTGETSLKELIAFSDNKTIIKDLLSKDENIEIYYYHGEAYIPLYQLYAIIGDYEKALENFQKKHNYACGFTEDFPNGLNDEGYAYAGWEYKDYLVEFIKKVCSSLECEEEIINQKDLINRILINERIKYIDLEEVLPPAKEVLSNEDFGSLLDTLTEKYNDGNLNFIVANDRYEGLFTRYIVRVATDEEVQNTLSSFKKENQNKVLSLRNTSPKRKDD